VNFFSWFTKAHLGLLKILELWARHIQHYLKLQWRWLTVDKLHSASVKNGTLILLPKFAKTEVYIEFSSASKSENYMETEKYQWKRELKVKLKNISQLKSHCYSVVFCCRTCSWSKGGRWKWSYWYSHWQWQHADQDKTKDQLEKCHAIRHIYALLYMQGVQCTEYLPWNDAMSCTPTIRQPINYVHHCRLILQLSPKSHIH